MAEAAHHELPTGERLIVTVGVMALYAVPSKTSAIATQRMVAARKSFIRP